MTLYQILIDNFAALFPKNRRGIERQWHQRTMGLITNALIDLSAPLFISPPSLAIQTSDNTQVAVRGIKSIRFFGDGPEIALHIMFRPIAKIVNRQRPRMPRDLQYVGDR